MRNRNQKNTDKSVNLNEEKGDLFMMTRAQLLETVKRTINEAKKSEHKIPKDHDIEIELCEGRSRAPLTIQAEDFGDDKRIIVKLGKTTLFTGYGLYLFVGDRHYGYDDPTDFRDTLEKRGITFSTDAAFAICRQIEKLGGHFHPILLPRDERGERWAKIQMENLQFN